MDKDKLISVLNDFFGMDGKDGTYAYWLTRVKEAFAVGTMNLDDFVEFNEETINDLADHIISKMEVVKNEQ